VVACRRITPRPDKHNAKVHEGLDCLPVTRCQTLQLQAPPGNLPGTGLASRNSQLLGRVWRVLPAFKVLPMAPRPDKYNARAAFDRTTHDSPDV
jgi:hypothetical protein